MAVTFKTDESYGFKLMSLFGVSANLIVAAKNAGITVSQTTPGTFRVDLGDQSFGAVAIKGAAITMAKAGTLGPSAKTAVCIQFEGALKKALGGTAGAAIPDVLDPKSVADALVSSQTTTKGVLGGGLKPTPKSTENGYYLEQKIAGTSDGSVYLVFALLEGSALAGRVKNGVLSIRALASLTCPLAPKLMALGFTLKNGKYYSAHYSCGTSELVVKTVGAVIGTLGFENVKSVANLKGLFNV